jgi:hypothetical protein
MTLRTNTEVSVEQLSDLGSTPSELESVKQSPLFKAGQLLDEDCTLAYI